MASKGALARRDSRRASTKRRVGATIGLETGRAALTMVSAATAGGMLLVLAPGAVPRCQLETGRGW
jgi:hypothetical protein